MGWVTGDESGQKTEETDETKNENKFAEGREVENGSKNDIEEVDVDELALEDDELERSEDDDHYMNEDEVKDKDEIEQSAQEKGETEDGKAGFERSIVRINEEIERRQNYGQAIDNLEEEIERRQGHGQAIDNIENKVKNRQNSSDGGENGEGNKSNEGRENGIEEVLGRSECLIDEDKVNRIHELEEWFEKMRPELADLYAKNRRLFVGSENRAEFNRIRGEYDERMTEYLRLKARESYEAQDDNVRKKLQAKFDERKAGIDEQVLDFAGGDFENTEKIPEEIEELRQRLLDVAAENLKQEYGDLVEAAKTKVNADFLEKYIEQENDLWSDTNDKLDKGSIFRKAVSKIITNKHIKGALIGAAVVGLAVTGVGLATGAVVLGGAALGAGTAIGAAKGAITGLVMSRQSSESSALNAVDAETRSQNIREQLEGIDFLAENDDVRNAVSWMMEQYNEAKNIDRKSNVKRTAISAGLGAAIGAVVGSVQVGSESSTPVVKSDFKGYDPISYDVSNNLSNINIPEGHGAATTFQQLGGDPANYSQFEQILHNVAHQYQMSPGSNGVVAGYDGTVGDFAFTYEGQISEWPDVARSMIADAAKQAAEQGLIPAQQVGGGAIYDTTVDAIREFTTDWFRSFLAWGTVAAGYGAGVGIATDRKNQAPLAGAPTITPPVVVPETVGGAGRLENEVSGTSESKVNENETNGTSEPEVKENETSGTSEPEVDSTNNDASEVLGNTSDARETAHKQYRAEVETIAGVWPGMTEQMLDYMAMPQTNNVQNGLMDRVVEEWRKMPQVTKDMIRGYMNGRNDQDKLRYGNVLRLAMDSPQS